MVQLCSLGLTNLLEENKPKCATFIMVLFWTMEFLV